ncbi:hypothetical protein LZP69_00850 [Shewanella sp. AS1]|uniref:hypothetical protein n=1 Tax=Shewanella sp. AS1 TaxID=2907626 RepID=UPI001F3D4BB3|nr:hypothetical protein [Shewanella sp. AS1]MCE9677738.1 hypothetical protein [Shewanella sp. AS1]
MKQERPQDVEEQGEEPLYNSIDNSININRLNNSYLTNDEVHHLWHFLLTLLTFGLWGIVWWRIILRSEGEAGSLFHDFDDAYWSHLIERERPPAALYHLQFDVEQPSSLFEA